MKRVFSATCLAAAFAVGLSAQSTTGTATSAGQNPPTTTTAQGQGRANGPRTVTGCLRAGDTAGTYMLTDVMMQGGGRRAGDTTAGSTTAGGTMPPAGTAAQGRGMGPQSIMLTADSSVDLKAHVGHKIEVTGTMAGGRGGAGMAGGSTASGTSTGTGSTATGSTTTGTGMGTAAGGQRAGGRGGMRSMTVTSVRMVSESCS